MLLRIFRRWWVEGFLPLVRSYTKTNVLLLMDDCINSSLVEFKDPEEQVQVMVFPPSCTPVYQPCGQGIVVSTKHHYRGRLLDFKAEKFEDAAAVRGEARRKRMKAGTADLAEEHHPHMRDVCELLRAPWCDVASDTIAR